MEGKVGEGGEEGGEDEIVAEAGGAAWHDRYSRYFPFSFDGFLLDDNNLDSALKPLNLIKLLSFSNARAGI